MYIKRISKMMLVLVICIIDWCSSNLSLIKLYEEQIITKRDVLLNIMSPNTGYESFLKCIMILSLPFLLFYEHFAIDSSPEFLIRSRSREYYCKMKTWRIAMAGLLFAIIHEMVNLIGIIGIFSIAEILEYNIIYAEYVQVVNLTIFYLQIGIIYEILRLYIGKVLSLVSSFVMCATQYYVYLLFQPTWLPMYDLLYMDRIVTQNIDVAEVVVMVGRNVALIYILGKLYTHIFRRDDIYDY